MAASPPSAMLSLVRPRRGVMDDKTRKGMLTVIITAMAALALWGLVSKIQSTLKEGAKGEE